MDVVMQHLSEILSFLAGALGGAALTIAFTRNSVKNGGTVVDQSKARAKGDIVGGNKSVRKN
jgi:hypothetical protein